MKYPAKFTKKTKEQILERDWSCILCWWQAHSIHHVYFSRERIYTKERNDADQWVTLCFDCHLKSHSCKSWEWERQECILYLDNL